jgi:hypothetical protein
LVAKLARPLVSAGLIVGPDEDDPESDGVADPSNHGPDANNDNQGDGSSGGEDNVVSVIPPGTILNGPSGQPGASGNIFGVGPDNNHDFQNLATLPAGTDPSPDDGTVVDPAAQIFNNTLSNPDATNPLNNVLLQPISPGFGTIGGDNADLPAGTTVRIDITIGGILKFAEYTYDGTQFNITDGLPILIPSISPGVTLNYTTTVDLPAVGDPVNADGSGSSPGTPLSTDRTGGGTGNNLVGGFPVPMIAFIDAGAINGTPDPGETSNITVNQIYTGFLRLVKQSRILQGAGPAVASGESTFSITPKNPAPGNIIEYRVVYRNISEPQAGSGTNVVLSAENVVITEDGTNNLPNNWALDLAPVDGVLATLHVINTASDTGGGTINYTQQAAITFLNGLFTSSGTIDPGNTVTGYQVTGLTVAPTGTAAFDDFDVEDDPIPAGFFEFRFQRQVSFDTQFPPAP